MGENTLHFNPVARQPIEDQMQNTQLMPLELFLIEDNPADVQLMWHVFAECGIKVNIHIAMDGAQALQMLREPEFHPNLIVLDLNIPKISGLEVLEQLSKETPVVVFSSTTDEREKQRALDLGAREFASKPSDLQEYAEAICGMVRKWAPQKTSVAAEA